MLFTTDDVIASFRSDVADPLRGPAATPDIDALWKVSDTLRYINEAANITAAETRSLQRTFDFPFTALGGPLYRLPTSFEILDIHRMYLNGARYALTEQNLGSPHIGLWDYDELLGTGDVWTTQTGTPRYFTREYRAGYLRLLPIPTADDYVTITATVAPQNLSLGQPLPFDNYRDIQLVLLWMKKMAYAKQDVDTFDAGRSDSYATEFERRALERRYEAERLRRPAGTVAFSW